MIGTWPERTVRQELCGHVSLTESCELFLDNVRTDRNERGFPDMERPAAFRKKSMPDVGLTTATEPLSPDAKVIIKYSVEIDGLAVYTETYDSAKLAEELAFDREKASELWLRRIDAVVRCRHQPEFSASLTRFLATGQ